MENCTLFTPNRENHPEFADVLLEAEKDGVNIKALNCTVTENGIYAKGFVNIKLK